MKKYFCSHFIAFIIGGILFSGLTVFATISYEAVHIDYRPTDTTWKKADGSNIETVKDALDSLYLKSLTLGNQTIEYKYGAFQQLGNYSKAEKSYSFTATTDGKIIVIMNATGSNSGVTNRTTRYVKIDGVSQTLTNIVADDWQFATYYIGSVEKDQVIEAKVSNAAAGSLNTAGLFVYFIH